METVALFTLVGQFLGLFETEICGDLNFSQFPDPAVEANFTHKGVRFFLSTLFLHNICLEEKANDVAVS